MAYDCRVYSGFERHPKFIAIKEIYGDGGVLGVVILWGYAAEYRPNGVLHGMSREGICRACQIDLKYVDYVDFLVKCRLLDCSEDGVYSIHNWERRQPNCFNRDKISAQKSRAVSARWDRERAKKEARERRKTKAAPTSNNDDTSSIQDVKQPKYPNPTQPNPNINPSLSPLSREEPSEGERAREIFLGLLHEAVPGATLKSPERWDRMFGRLLEAGQTLDQVEAVMRFALVDSFWRSRVLSHKAFGDNYTTLCAQMIEQQQTDIVAPPQKNNGMTSEEWEQLKQTQKVEAEKLSQAPP